MSIIIVQRFLITFETIIFFDESKRERTKER